MPALAVPVSGTAASGTPSAVQQRAAIKRASRSKGLWATINICNTRKHRDTVGIRGQIPALGFPTTLSLVIGLDYYVPQSGSFKAIPKVKMTIPLGTATNGYLQGGATFKFKPPEILSGTVEFEWHSGKRLIGSVAEKTTGGHKGVDQADPPKYSAATCRIGG